MEIKHIKRHIGRSLALGILKLMCATLSFLPKFCLYGFAELIARAGYLLAFKQRRIAQDSLRIAFGNEKTKKEIKDIIIGCFATMSKGFLETVASVDKHAALDEMVKIEGRDNLDKALAKGKGVVLVSAHFGNFPLLLLKLAILKYKVNIVIRRMRDEKADAFFDKKITESGVKSIYSQPRNICVRKSIDALRNNEVLFMLMDQNFGTGGIFVNFFGRKAATATGPVVFSLRTKSPILPVFMIREKNNQHLLIIEPEVQLEQRGDNKQNIRAVVIELTEIIEKYIRKYPAEWGWIHRRWKSRPNK